MHILYTPQAPPHHLRFDPAYNFSGGLLDIMWVLESGIMTFRPTSQARALAASAVELYEGLQNG